ncbi:MaoC/PaaZ C-terminal domain-containing protein [Nocardiopsis sp. L17-MgMaSL7]|uniref:MaoC/PaaZ C-terminal domain-containing protein n=1 Tax=Nocardiopsis sp. L17-MgMaSL7 TaxID=1938893 RepID=UPI000D7155B9|nr:MaoC/PaaZ C-terminal domain-containing protein [Nocardiopsis sp. L17-MgMaSL7]PWV57626.1 MaoC dehydratase-like protein [Nocardiopsis sp. L17-MgMaSL7]
MNPGSAWRDLTDPRSARPGNDPEAGLKEPLFENLEIPERLGPVTVRVDDHKIKRFAFTQDDHHPWHLESSPFEGRRVGHAALLGNDLVQLFTTVYAASRVVGLHTEEQLWFDSPAYLDEDVTLEGTYTEAYERRGQGYVVMEATATGQDGRSVLRHRGVEILRTRPGDVAGRGSSAPGAGPRRVTGEVPAGAAPFDPDAPRPGQVLAPLVKSLTTEQAAVFSRVGEYVRNIHNDLDLAREAGLRVPIVQGQQQFGVLAELLTRAVGAPLLTGGWMRVKFLNTVDVHEPFEAAGVVTAVDHDRTEFEIWVRRADGKLSAAGWASAPHQTSTR